MRKDKQKAFELRKLGRSYREIQKELGISRSTLCDWFRDIPWSKHLAQSNKKRTTSLEQVKIMHEARAKKLKTLYEETESKANLEYEIYSKEPLFWAGLMVYAGEGEKRTKHTVKVTNSEFYLHRVFIAFCIQYLQVKKEDIRCELILYPDLNESLCKEMWSNILSIPRSSFYKTQVIQGKEIKKRLQYGVAMSIISSTVLKKKVLTWLSLAQKEKFY